MDKKKFNDLYFKPEGQRVLTEAFAMATGGRWQTITIEETCQAGHVPNVSVKLNGWDWKNDPADMELEDSGQIYIFRQNGSSYEEHFMEKTLKDGDTIKQYIQSKGYGI